MAMKKIKPQYGKVVPPTAKTEEEGSVREVGTDVDAALSAAVQNNLEFSNNLSNETGAVNYSAQPIKGKPETEPALEELEKPALLRSTSIPNPFLQTKDVFGKARLTKIGYRMRTEYVEILDIIKKIKKENGYTLEAVLDDALTFYLENSEDGKEALRKAEIFYS